MNCVMATGLKYSNILFVRIEANGGNVVGEKLDVKSIPSFLLFKEGGYLTVIMMEVSMRMSVQ